MLRYWAAPWTALGPRTALLQSAPRAVQRLAERSLFCRMRQRGAPEPPAKGQAEAPREAQRVTSGRRHVTTAFVQRPDDGRVLLVQRSERVSTYQFQWGGVSGGIELSDASPVARALIEVRRLCALGPRPSHPLALSLSPSPSQPPPLSQRLPISVTKLFTALPLVP